MALIKSEPVMDPTTLQTSVERDQHDKKIASEEYKSLDMDTSGIKVEYTDSCKDFISDIKVTTHDSFCFLKSEAEEESYDKVTVKEEMNLEEIIRTDYFLTESAEFGEHTIPEEETLNPKADAWETIAAKSKATEEIVLDVAACTTSVQDKRKKSQVNLKTRKEVVLKRKSNQNLKSVPDSSFSEDLPWKCYCCGKSYAFENLLKKHSRIHSLAKTFKCNLCSKIFQRRSFLLLHLSLHTDENPMKCKVCGKIFSSVDSLKKHEPVHTKNFLFKCTSCSKYLSTAFSLKNHKLIHSGKKPHSCEICGKSFRYLGNCKAHERIHTGEKPIECKICNKRYVNNAKLRVHMRIHALHETIDGGSHVKSSNTNDLMYSVSSKKLVCGMCNKVFGRSDSLKRHIRTYTGKSSNTNELMYSVSSKKLVVCGMCNKVFGRSDSLKRHIRTHTGEKPYKCELCQRCFADVGNRNAHFRLHLRKDFIKCLICTEAFQNVKKFKSHMQDIHKNKLLNCDKSGKENSFFHMLCRRELILHDHCYTPNSV